MSNKVAFEIVTKDDKARADLEKYLQTFEGGAVKIKDSAKDVDDAWGKAGKGIENFLSNSITGMVSLAAVVGTVTAALREQEQIANQAAEEAMTVEQSIRQLAQLGGGAAAQAARVAAGQDIAIRYGIDQVQANQFVHQLVSSGLTPEQAVQEARVFELAGGSELVGGALAVQKAFGKAEAGGQLSGIESKLLAGSIQAKATVNEFGQEVAKVAVSSSRIGASDEETMATLAALSLVTQDTSQAATLQKAFGTSVERLAGRTGMDDLMQGGIVEAARRIRAEGLDTVQDLGSAEAVQALDLILKEADTIDRGTRRIAAAQGQDLVQQQIQEMYAADEQNGGILLATRNKRIKEQEAVAARRRKAADELRQDAGVLQVEAMTVDDPAVVGYGLRAAANALDTVGMDVNTETVGEYQSGAEALVNPVETAKEFADALYNVMLRMEEALDRNTNATERNTDGGAPVPGGEAGNRY